MALKARLSKEDHAKLSDVLKAEYKADGAGFILDVTEDGTLSLHDSSTLSKALEMERGLKAALEKELAPFKGMDAEAAKEALRNKEVFRGGADDRLKAVEDKYKAELAAAKDAHKKDADGFTGFVRKQRTAAAIAEAKGNADLLLPHVMPHVGVTAKDGDFDVFIVDEKGVPRITKTPGASGNMSLTEYLASMRADEKYKAAFYSEQKSGNGTPLGSSGGGGGGGSPTTIARGDIKSAGANIEAIAAGTAKVQ